MLEDRKTWCTKKYLNKIKSTEILIKRKSIEPLKKVKSIKETRKAITTPKRIGTPKRTIQLMSPNGYIEIKSKIGNKKYGSSRRIDFL
jgi:hypothetical protein